jgi:hypothetical protein
MGLGFWVRVGLGLGFLGFGGTVQRRGVHVKTPEIGSRDAQKCFWGNLGFYAELRRECFGVWVVGQVLKVLEGVAAWGREEGGQLVFLLCVIVVVGVLCDWALR